MVVPLAEPRCWPAESGYREVVDGWLVSEDSMEWLYKPSSGVYFHSPTETLWKCVAENGPRHFVRVDRGGDSRNASGELGRGGGSGHAADLLSACKTPGASRLSEIVARAFGESGSVLLRRCFKVWRREALKFEEMERDLLECCDEARTSTEHIARPRTSAPSVSCRRDSFTRDSFTCEAGGAATCTSARWAASDRDVPSEPLVSGLSQLLGLFTWSAQRAEQVDQRNTAHSCCAISYRATPGELCALPAESARQGPLESSCRAPAESSRRQAPAESSRRMPAENSRRAPAEPPPPPRSSNSKGPSRPSCFEPPVRHEPLQPVPVPVALTPAVLARHNLQPVLNRSRTSAAGLSRFSLGCTGGGEAAEAGMSPLVCRRTSLGDAQPAMLSSVHRERDSWRWHVRDEVSQKVISQSVTPSCKTPQEHELSQTLDDDL